MSGSRTGRGPRRPEDVETRRAEGKTLRRYFEGLPVLIAIVGSQANLAYRAHPAVAIESQTGLTDHWIAHQPLTRRGRVGHEKLAPVSYLLSRKVDFVIHHFATVSLGLKQSVPLVPIDFDRIPGFMVHWNPPLLAELARRDLRGERFGGAGRHCPRGHGASTDMRVMDSLRQAISKPLQCPAETAR